MKYTPSYISFKTLAILIAFVLLLSSCKNSSIETTASNEPIIIEDSISESRISVARDDTILVNMPDAAVSYNPFGIKNEDMATLFSIVFEPAIRISSDGSFLPSIIESWAVDETGLTYTFSVRKGVSYHDIELGYVTANDLKQTIDMILSFEDGESIYSEYADSIEFSAVADEYTLIVKGKKQNRDVLCFMNFPVVPSSLYSQYELESTAIPIGTGPYKYELTDEKGALHFIKNESWWKTTPNIGTVIAVPTEDASSAIYQYQKGELNCIITSLINAKNLCNNTSTSVYMAPTNQFDCLIPNTGSSVLARKEIRQAIACVIDRKQLITNVLGGMGSIAETPLRINQGLINSEDTDDNTSHAEALLRAAGYTYLNGVYRDVSGIELNIELIYCENENISYRKRVASEIKEQLEEFGIKISIRELTAGELSSAIKNRNFDLALASFSLKKNNDIAFVFEEGYCAYTSDALKNTISAFNNSFSESTADAALVDIYSILSDELPIIGLYRKCSTMFIDDSYTGINSVSYLDMFANIAEWEYKTQ